MINSYSPEKLVIYRNEYVRQAELRLTDLKTIEGKCRGAIPIVDADMQDLFGRLLPSTRHRNAIAHHAGQLNGKFGREHRRALYCFLAELVEVDPWRFPW
jgi:hypothetical protein